MCVNHCGDHISSNSSRSIVTYTYTCMCVNHCGDQVFVQNHCGDQILKTTVIDVKTTAGTCFEAGVDVVYTVLTVCTTDLLRHTAAVDCTDEISSTHCTLHTVQQKLISTAYYILYSVHCIVEVDLDLVYTLCTTHCIACGVLTVLL